jgi:hypothetical protein
MFGDWRITIGNFSFCEPPCFQPTLHSGGNGAGNLLQFGPRQLTPWRGMAEGWQNLLLCFYGPISGTGTVRPQGPMARINVQCAKMRA